jgi:hypothetical protein
VTTWYIVCANRDWALHGQHWQRGVGNIGGIADAWTGMTNNGSDKRLYAYWMTMIEVKLNVAGQCAALMQVRGLRLATSMVRWCLTTKVCGSFHSEGKTRQLFQQ